MRRQMSTRAKGRPKLLGGWVTPTEHQQARALATLRGTTVTELLRQMLAREVQGVQVVQEVAGRQEAAPEQAQVEA